jgi:surface protein
MGVADPFEFSFASAKDARVAVIKVLNELCDSQASLNDMWRWKNHGFGIDNLAGTKRDPHELDKRHGQALIHKRKALAEILAFRGGNWERDSLKWLNNDTIRDAKATYNISTGIHPVYGHIKWWATGKVTNMHALFAGGQRLMHDLGDWDVSSVKNMSFMFSSQHDFLGVGLNKWDVSNVEDMNHMFAYTLKFNANLSAWNVSKVRDMSYMFANTSSFTGRGLHLWDVSAVNNMSYMFLNANSFKEDLEAWQVSEDVNMESMFMGAERIVWSLLNRKLV